MNKLEYGISLMFIMGMLVMGSFSMALMYNEGQLASWPVHMLQDSFDFLKIIVVFCFGFLISGILGLTAIAEELKRLQSSSKKETK